MQISRLEGQTHLESRVSRQFSEFELKDLNKGTFDVERDLLPQQRSLKSKRSTKSNCPSALINKLLLETHQIVPNKHGSLFTRGYSNPLSLNVRLGIALKGGDKSKVDELARDNSSIPQNNLRSRLKAVLDKVDARAPSRSTSKKPTMSIKTHRPNTVVKSARVPDIQLHKSEAGTTRKGVHSIALQQKPRKQGQLNLRPQDVSLGPGLSHKGAYLQPTNFELHRKPPQKLKSNSHTQESFFPQRYPMKLKEDKLMMSCRMGRSQSTDKSGHVESVQTKLSLCGSPSRISFLMSGSNNRDTSRSKHPKHSEGIQFGISLSKSQLLTNNTSRKYLLRDQDPKPP